MKTFDVIIVGGGVVGAAIARELSQYKLSVALFEKEIELAFGVSKSNSGIIHPGTQNSPDSLKGKLCVEGNRLTRDLAGDLGVDFKQVGELIVAFNDDDVQRLEKIKEDADKLGVPDLKIVNRKWLREKEPNLSPKVVAALYAPTAGIISPYRWVYDLSENAAENGVEIFTSKKVEKIVAPHVNHSEYFTVTAGGITDRARYIVNAAGLFADDIARMVGITDFCISPRKGEE